MRFRKLPLLLGSLSLACDPADNVRIQELPPLTESSIEDRLGLPLMEGPWRFAGWELAEGDSLGLEADLPALGVLALETQQRDSLGGYYLTEGGGSAPLYGEVRRDSVVALVAFLQEGDGRYLVGRVLGDTLWVESTTLVDPESWRPGARPAFVRSRTPITPFVRIRGALPPPAVDTAGLAATQDSVARPTGAVSAATGAAVPTRGAADAGRQTQPPAARQVEPARPPTPIPDSAPRAEPELPARRPQPSAIERREPPRLLGVPIQRDTADDQ